MPGVACAQAPREGLRGVVVHVDEAHFLPDGRAHVVGRGEVAVFLGETWVDESAGMADMLALYIKCHLV